MNKYNGIDHPEIYLSLNKCIYNVTTSTAYKPDGSYKFFAGHEIASSLGKHDSLNNILNLLLF